MTMPSGDYPCIFNDSGTVTRYEQLRHITPNVMESVCTLVWQLASRVPSVAPVRILDAGAGTGRFAIPIADNLAMQACRAELVALDMCQPMLNKLAERWPLRDSSVRLLCVQHDLQDALPPPAKPGDVIFTIATFHILKRWKDALSNLVEALSPGGYFIFVRENNQFMHQTEGFEKDSDFPCLDATLSAFMQFYHEQRAAAGEPYQPKTLRYSDMMPAVQHLHALGLFEETMSLPESDFSWQKPHNFADILHCFRHKQMTTWGSDLSDQAREQIASALEKWVTSRGIEPAKEFVLSARLIPHVFRKQR